MGKISFLKHSIYFSLFFITFYFETLELFGLKFAIIWKSIFIIFIIFKFLFSKKSIVNKKYLFYGYLFNLKKLFTLSTFTSFSASLSQLSRSVIFPIVLSYFNNFYSKKQLSIISQILPLYVIISTLPFLFGILEPLKQGYDLSSYGLDSFGFIGIFQNCHSASMVLAFSLLVTLYFLKYTNSNYQKIFYFVLILIGGYALIQTYVRTGIAMLLIGIIILYLHKNKISNVLKIIPLAAILIALLFTYYQNNDALQMRFQDKNIYNQSNTEFDNIGSGRLKIATYAINNWWDEGYLSIFIGLGEKLSREKMANTKGSAVFAHNGFIEILQTDGILGILLYFNFIFLIYKSIKKNKESHYYKLAISLLAMYLTGMFFQGGDNIFIYIILASSLMLLDKDRSIIIKNKL